MTIPTTLGQSSTGGNMALLQAGLTQELQPLSLSITFGAWRQVAAFKSRLQQARNRYKFSPTHSLQYPLIKSRTLRNSFITSSSVPVAFAGSGKL